MTNAIFQDEMYQLYVQKDLSYKKVTSGAKGVMQALIKEMQQEVCDSPVIEQKMQELVFALGTVRGKKQYGYLPKDVKGIVDSIVDELAKQPEVAACYDAWNKLRDELEAYYKDKPRKHLPLFQQKEFRAIKNMVIREAENIRLGIQTFEDDEPVGAEELPTLEKAAESGDARHVSSRQTLHGWRRSAERYEHRRHLAQASGRARKSLCAVHAGKTVSARPGDPAR